MTFKRMILSLSLSLATSLQTLAREDGAAAYVRESQRWEKSMIDMNFLKTLINNQNCETSLQVFSGCLLTLEFYANMDETTAPLYKSVKEAEQAQVNRGKVIKNAKSKSETKIAIRDQSLALPDGAKVLFEAPPLRIISVEVKSLEKFEGSFIEPEEYKKLDSAQVLERQKDAKNRTLSRLQQMHAKVIAKSTHPIESILRFLETQKKYQITKFAVSMLVNEYLQTARDPHSHILLWKEYREDAADPGQQFVGIGVELGVDEKTKLTEIRNIFEKTGAFDAGLQIGDLLKSAAGVSLEDKSIDDVVKLVRGPEGTQVKITVIRDQREIEMVVVRKKVVISSVQSDELKIDGQIIGYAKLTSFSNENQCNQLSGIFSKFEENPKVKGAIFDLRNNLGGSVAIASCIASLFLGPQFLVTVLTFDQSNHLPKAAADQFVITRSSDKKEQTFVTQGKKVFSKNLVVLVNERSASASELLAAALRDHNRAYLVGNITFGKGSSMMNKMDSDTVVRIGSYEMIPDGMTVLMATNGLFFSPSGRTHQGSGLTPHIRAYRDIQPNMVEKIAIGLENQYLFPLAVKSYVPNLKADEIKAMDQLKVPTVCVSKAGVEDWYKANSKADKYRDMQVLSGLALHHCLLDGRN